MTPKCSNPQCGQLITQVRISKTSGVSGTMKYKCVTFSCPYCFTVLGVQMDPLAVASEIVQAVKSR